MLLLRPGFVKSKLKRVLTRTVERIGALAPSELFTWTPMREKTEAPTSGPGLLAEKGRGLAQRLE
ncbi:MAG: hypothetical protein AMJ46_08145 [Latescibacteria bacterium DG_63]|nr:MAG: hypothetical protein AMJ46_08145 [Latescibacteria bacterium DG_63]